MSAICIRVRLTTVPLLPLMLRTGQIMMSRNTRPSVVSVPKAGGLGILGVKTLKEVGSFFRPNANDTDRLPSLHFSFLFSLLLGDPERE